MGHPFASHSANIVERQRVGKITQGYDRSAPEGVPYALQNKIGDDRAVSRKTDGTTTRIAGVGGEKQARARLDRPHRAKGGRVGRTNVNVIIAGKGDQPMPGMAPSPPSMPIPAPGASLPPPGGAPGLPPMPMRARGGKVKARGDKTPVKAEGMRNGTPAQPSAGQNDLAYMSTKPAITRAKGGKVFPKMDAGAMSGEGRLEKRDAYGAKQRKS